MPAQPGDAILLQYGPQGAQQPGGSILLSYDVAVEGGPVRVRSGVVGTWARADKKIRDLFAPQPATVREDQNKRAPWAMAEAINDEGGSTWVSAARTDNDDRAPWGMFGDMLNEDAGSEWKAARPADDQRAGPWAAFGDMLNEDRGGKWKGSKEVDAEREGEWSGSLVQFILPVPYQRPAGDAADFFAIGGGISATFGDGYTPPAGNAIAFQFGADAYIPPFYQPTAEWYQPPAGNAAGFLYAPEKAPVFDEFGNPVMVLGFVDPSRLGVWGTPVERDRDTTHPWLKYSRPLNPGWGVVIPEDPGTDPGETITIPVRRVYIVLNEVMLVRVSGATPIEAITMTVNFDCDSWLPSFSATIPESARDAVMPDPNPVEVEALINGVQFRFFVEKIQRNRQFPQKTVSISGRGIACELDSPYAVASQHTNASAMTVQQIIDAALGFSTYTQTWNITDWLVPANTFSLFGTPAEVAANVADAAGAVLAADWALRDLRMLPRYPVKPWEWASADPDYVIPGAVAQSEALEWVEKPAYNVVYVSGVQAGVLGHVKITGTAGDLPAPMITHQLITHADGARQKGTSILCDTGRKAIMQISLPVLPETGVIDVCKLIEFNDGATTRRGIVRANSIAVNFPTVRQTLTIEAAA